MYMYMYMYMYIYIYARIKHYVLVCLYSTPVQIVSRFLGPEEPNDRGCNPPHDAGADVLSSFHGPGSQWFKGFRVWGFGV